MKKFLLTALFGLAALGAMAETETLTFSYCSQPCHLNSFGASVAQTYGAAMLLDQPVYTGMKVVKIDAYLNMDASSFGNISDTRLFISTKLPQPTANPDLLSTAVAPKNATWKNYNGNKEVDEAVAVLSYELNTPLTLTGEPIYFGYFLNVNKVVGEGERHPILLDKDAQDANAFWYYDRHSAEGQWTNSSYTSGAAVIVVTLERETAPYSLSLSSPGNVYAEVGKDFSYPFPVSNSGQNPVQTFSYTYSIDGGEPVAKSLTLQEPLAPSLTESYVVMLDFAAQNAVGHHNLEVSITEVDGQPNQADVVGVEVGLDIFPYMPKRLPLVEEFTSLYCGFCPRGYVAMEYLGEEYPDDAALVCYHFNFQGKQEDMAFTDTPPMNTSSYPNASIDRMSIIDPYYGVDINASLNAGIPLKDMGIIDALFARNADVPFADIQIKSVEVSLPDSVINVTTDVTFMKEVKGDQYRVGYVLTCNNMKNLVWGQTNYFSGDKNYKDTPLIQDFYSLNPTVYGLTYNDVAIDVKAMRGVSGSISADVEVGVPVSHEYSFNVSNIVNINGKNINRYASINNMVVNAFVVDRTTGQIVNAAKFPVGNVYDAVESIEAESDAPAVYYDINGRRVANPDKGIFIMLKDGKATKIIR